jgi:antitoxin (DNA-binding transcriptional repressor) of toxin-antitoxin stability system
MTSTTPCAFELACRRTSTQVQDGCVNTIETRDLEQYVDAVIQRVLATGEEYEITAHGDATGVRLAPIRPGPRRWVSSAVLNADEPAMTPEESEAWLADITELADVLDDEITGPWDRQ